MPDHALTPADVSRIAKLAHLELTPDETARFTHELTRILEYAERLRDIDTTGVEPAPRAVQDISIGALRPDELLPSLPVDDALANAPDAAKREGLFRVPKVIGG